VLDPGPRRRVTCGLPDQAGGVTSWVRSAAELVVTKDEAQQVLTSAFGDEWELYPDSPDTDLRAVGGAWFTLWVAKDELS
jgi:hypothetical protein